MSADHGPNGAKRYTEFDAVAELRKEVDGEIAGLDRRLGIVESILTARVDGVDIKLGRVLDEIKLNGGELAEIRKLLGRFIDLQLDTQKRVAALETRRTKKRK